MEETVRPAIFGGAELRLEQPATDTARAALQAFLALTPADRRSLTRHVSAYCIDFTTYTGEPPDAVIADPEAVWDLVRPLSLHVDDEYAPSKPPCVVVDAACDWEPEHGLALVFLEGRELVRCGPYDGHLYNNPTSDDAILGPVVYDAHDPAYTTRHTP